MSNQIKAKLFFLDGTVREVMVNDGAEFFTTRRFGSDEETGAFAREKRVRNGESVEVSLRRRNLQIGSSVFVFFVEEGSNNIAVAKAFSEFFGNIFVLPADPSGRLHRDTIH